MPRIEEFYKYTSANLRVHGLCDNCRPGDGACSEMCQQWPIGARLSLLSKLPLEVNKLPSNQNTGAVSAQIPQSTHSQSALHLFPPSRTLVCCERDHLINFKNTCSACDKRQWKFPRSDLIIDIIYLA